MIVFAEILLCLLCIATIVYPFVVDRLDDYKDKKCSRVYTIIGSIALAILLLGFNSIVVIPTGYTGVKTAFGQIDENVIQSGLNFKIPIVQSIEKVNNKQQDVNFNGKIWSETSARTAIYYDDITITYQINAEHSAWIYANVSGYKKRLVDSGIVASSVKSSSKILSDTDATNRAIIEPLIKKNLQKALDEKYGVNVVSIVNVVVGNADFSAEYNKAVAKKQEAKLKAEKQRIENQNAIDKAEADAKVKKTNAEAEANARLISARAEEKANELVAKSLSNQVLNEIWIKKWNGQLPQYYSGLDTSLMIGINSENK